MPDDQLNFSSNLSNCPSNKMLETSDSFNLPAATTSHVSIPITTTSIISEASERTIERPEKSQKSTSRLTYGAISTGMLDTFATPTVAQHTMIGASNTVENLPNDQSLPSTSNSAPVGSFSTHREQLKQTLARLIMQSEGYENQFIDHIDMINSFEFIIRKVWEKLQNMEDELVDLECRKKTLDKKVDEFNEKYYKLGSFVKEMKHQLSLPPITQDIVLSGGSVVADIRPKNLLQQQQVELDVKLMKLDDAVSDVTNKFAELRTLQTETIDDNEDVSAMIRRSKINDSINKTMQEIRKVLFKQIDMLNLIEEESDRLVDKAHDVAKKVLKF